MAAPPPQSVMEYGWAILTTSDSSLKAKLTLEANARYRSNEIPLARPSEWTYTAPPDMPARPDGLKVVDLAGSRKMSGLKNKQIAFIHSLAHIESFAIDLSWDILYRFANEAENHAATVGVELPVEFFEDWLRVASEEARHYTLWANRLKALGSFYGALPVHNGLWQSASCTSDDILARLAIVHMVHEARGLDVYPKHIRKLSGWGDKHSVKLMREIYDDEITHVTSGMRWFQFVCAGRQPSLEPIATFHELVRRLFRGSLKPPFNTEARSAAGFTEEWYVPLAKTKSAGKKTSAGKSTSSTSQLEANHGDAKHEDAKHGDDASTTSTTRDQPSCGSASAETQSVGAGCCGRSGCGTDEPDAAKGQQGQWQSNRWAWAVGGLVLVAGAVAAWRWSRTLRTTRGGDAHG